MSCSLSSNLMDADKDSVSSGAFDCFFILSLNIRMLFRSGGSGIGSGDSGGCIKSACRTGSGGGGGG